MPTLVEAASRVGSMAAQVVASHHASSRGVPRTGRLPDPTARAVSSSVTVKLSVASIRAPSGRRSGATPGTGDQSRSGTRRSPGARRSGAPRSSRPGWRARSPRAPSSRARRTTRSISAVPTPRPLCAAGRPPASGTRASSLRADLPPRRGDRTERHRAEHLAGLLVLGHPELRLPVARRGVAQVLDVAVLGRRDELLVRRDGDARRSPVVLRSGRSPQPDRCIRSRRCCGGRPR